MNEDEARGLKHGDRVLVEVEVMGEGLFLDDLADGPCVDVYVRAQPTQGSPLCVGQLIPVSIRLLHLRGELNV